MEFLVTTIKSLKTYQKNQLKVRKDANQTKDKLSISKVETTTVITSKTMKTNLVIGKISRTKRIKEETETKAAMGTQDAPYVVKNVM